MSLKECLKLVNSYTREKYRDKFIERPYLEYALSQAESFLEGDEGKAVFITAPTGYGKTSLSLALSYYTHLNGYKTIVSYPLRSLIEDQVSKFTEFYSWLGMPRAVGKRMMGDRESPYLVHRVVLTTIDTFSLVSVGLAPEDIASIYKEKSMGHFLYSWGSAWLSTLIFDEAHLMLDSIKSLSILVAFLKLGLDFFGTNMFFLSATMPNAYLNKIRKSAGRLQSRIKIIHFSPEHDERFAEERQGKKYKINMLPVSSDNKLEEIEKRLNSAKFTRALVIFNTVEDAISFYRRIQYPNKILLHSRFTLKDKKDRIEQLKKLAEKPGEKFVLVSTQAVEAGVDISSDFIITELAPGSSLVQRFGRFLRRENENCVDPENCAYVWYEEDELEPSKRQYKVYDRALTEKTKNYLESHSTENLHLDYENLLSYVYSESDASIDDKYVRQLIDIFNSLYSSSERALQVFLNMAGSLVREGSLFIAVSSNGYEVPVDYSIIKKYCEGPDCPKSIHDAIEKSLSGLEKDGTAFKVRCNYDEETGLNCQG